MYNSVKILLLKFLVLVIALIAVDFVGGIALKNLFYKQKSGKYFTTTQALTNANQDILIFGNSHAVQHFDAPLMAKKLSKTVFNFGNQGQSLFYVYPLIKTILNHHKPKLIIINLDYNEFHYDLTDYQRLSIFLPYYHFNPVVDSTIALMGNNEMLKSKSILYRYNSTIGYMLLNTYHPTYNKSMLSLGFDPIQGDLCSSSNAIQELETKTEKVVFDRVKINYFINLVKYIHSQNVKLLVTTTPLYNYNHKYDTYKRQLQQVLINLNVSYLDDGENIDYKGQCDMFHDYSHLNAKGAAKWTEHCSQYITTHF